MMPMKNPPCPGESILTLCLEPLNLSVADAAAHLEVDEAYLKALCEGRGAIDADRRSDWSKPSAAPPTCGCGCGPPTTWRNDGSTVATSR